MQAFKVFVSFSFVVLSVCPGALAQQRKIPKNPFAFTDAVTRKPIREVLILPRYCSGFAIGIAPEGPGKGTYSHNLDKPFLYRAGYPFILKTPKFRGLPLLPLVIGKFGCIEGVLIVTPGYRALWFGNLWQTRDIFNTRDIRNLQLTPIPNNEWCLLMDQKLNPLLRESVVSLDNFEFWGVQKTEPKHPLYIRYNKDERQLIMKFLQSARIELTLRPIA